MPDENKNFLGSLVLDFRLVMTLHENDSIYTIVSPWINPGTCKS